MDALVAAAGVADPTIGRLLKRHHPVLVAVAAGDAVPGVLDADGKWVRPSAAGGGGGGGPKVLAAEGPPPATAARPIVVAMEALAAMHARCPLLYEQLRGFPKVAAAIWGLVGGVVGVAAVDHDAGAGRDPPLTVDAAVAAAAARLPDLFGAPCACCGWAFPSVAAVAAHQAATARTPEIGRAHV